MPINKYGSSNPESSLENHPVSLGSLRTLAYARQEKNFEEILETNDAIRFANIHLQTCLICQRAMQALEMADPNLIARRNKKNDNSIGVFP